MIASVFHVTEEHEVPAVVPQPDSVEEPDQPAPQQELPFPVLQAPSEHQGISNYVTLCYIL